MDRTGDRPQTKQRQDRGLSPAKRQPLGCRLHSCRIVRGSGHRLDVHRLLALRAFLHLELDLLVLLEGLEAAALDLGEMGEEVVAAAVRLDEAEALGVVEPLHGAGAHCVFLSLVSPVNPRGWGQRRKVRKTGTEVRRRFCRRILESLLTEPDPCGADYTHFRYFFASPAAFNCLSQSDQSLGPSTKRFCRFPSTFPQARSK